MFINSMYMLRGKKAYGLLLSLTTVVACLAGTPAAMAATTVGHNVSIGGTLSVTGGVSFSSATNTGYLSVGASPVSHNVSYANGSLNTSGPLSVDGAASVSSTLIVGGAATFRGNLLADAHGVPNLGSYTKAFNNVYSSGTMFGTALNLSGAGTLTSVTSTIVTSSKYISVGGVPQSFNASYDNGSLNVTGGLSVDAGVAVSSTLIVGGTVTFRGNVLADAHNVADIGSYTQAFKDVYASGTVFAGSDKVYYASSTYATTSNYLAVGQTLTSFDVSYANGSINAQRLALDGTASVSSTMVVGGVATFNAGLKIGGAGTTVLKHFSVLTGSLAFDAGANNCDAANDVTVIGAEVGDLAVASPGTAEADADLANASWSAAVTDNNTVTIRVCGDNDNPGSIDGTWRVSVWKY